MRTRTFTQIALASAFVFGMQVTNAQDAATLPTSAAPTPTQAAEDVLPIFTDHYPNAVGVTFQEATGGENCVKSIINFTEGDETLLKPMILKDVAERAKLDISTVSRVSNSKYVQTNFGIFPLKYFFNDGYTTDNGEELSVREIKRILKEVIDNEDKENPLTDDELAEVLKDKGYPIARRTVAKYRTQLNIPVARLRR